MAKTILLEKYGKNLYILLGKVWQKLPKILCMFLSTFSYTFAHLKRRLLLKLIFINNYNYYNN